MDFINIANEDAHSMDVFYHMEKLRSATDCNSLCMHLGIASTEPELDTSKPKVRRVQYDVHIARAEQKLKALCMLLRAKWSVVNIVMVHRIGYVEPGGFYMIVGVMARSAQHASAAVAHAAAEMGKLPVWKEETYEDGSRCWTSTHECFWRLNADEREQIDKTIQCKHGTKQVKGFFANARADDIPVRPKPCSDPNCVNRHDPIDSLP